MLANWNRWLKTPCNWLRSERNAGSASTARSFAHQHTHGCCTRNWCRWRSPALDGHFSGDRAGYSGRLHREKALHSVLPSRVIPFKKFATQNLRVPPSLFSHLYSKNSMPRQCKSPALRRSPKPLVRRFRYWLWAALHWRTRPSAFERAPRESPGFDFSKITGSNTLSPASIGRRQVHVALAVSLIPCHGCSCQLRCPIATADGANTGGMVHMGSDVGQDNERPVRRAWVDTFLLAATQVTNAEYALFLHYTDRDRPPQWHDPHFRHATQPVVAISWFDATDYCERPRSRTGQPFLTSE